MFGINKSPFKRTCVVETLEARRVLASIAGAAMHYEQLTPSQWAEQIADRIGVLPLSSTETDLQRFSSQENAIANLSEWAADNWESLFGQELTREFWEQYLPHPDVFFLEGPDRINLPWAAAGAPRIPFEVESVATPFGFTSLEVQDTTNRRLPGIDEADVVEFSEDGYVFVSHEQSLRIIDARNPLSLVEVSSIALANPNSRILLSRDHLIVASSPSWIGPGDTSEIRVYDITSKITPVLKSTFEIEGTLRTAKLFEGRLTLEVQNQIALPKPHLILADGVQETPRSLTRLPLGRFESRDEYMARIGATIVSMVLPDYSISIEGVSSESIDIGDWQDVVTLRDGFSRIQSAVLNIELNSQAPQLLDSEVVLDANPTFMHVTGETAYLVGQSNGWLRPFIFPVEPEPTTEILRFDFLPSGEVVAVAGGRVSGFVRDERMIDEFDGDLRVAVTETGGWDLPENSASILVLRPEDNRMSLIGQIEDIAPGQALLGAHFAGPSAIVTTAEMEGFIPLRDPLHSIDLSDPTNPLELDELEIPGATTHLQRIEDGLLIGVGSIQAEDGSWHDQVSLYDVSNPHNLRLAQTWTGESLRFPAFGNQAPDALAVHFDAETQTLIVPFARFNSGQNDFSRGASNTGAELFEIATGSSPSLNHLGTIHLGDRVNRASVVDGNVISVGDKWIQIATLDNLENVLSELSLQTPMVADHYSLPAGGRETLAVLDNDHFDPLARIVDVSDSTTGATIDIGGDGTYLIYDAPVKSDGVVDSFTYTVETSLGNRYTASVVVSLWQPIDATNETEVVLGVAAVNDEGQAVNELKPGDRIWLELSAESDGVSDGGIYQVIFDVTLDRTLFEVVSEPEPLDKFTNQFFSVESANGFSEIGGFADSFSPVGAGRQRIARFQVEVKNLGDLESTKSEIRVNAATSFGREVLVYDSDFPVARENITPASVVLTMASEVVGVDSEDVNGDGHVSALDALSVVNFLNREARVARVLSSVGEAEATRTSMDVNRDGLISAADVLSIVNRINRDNDVAAEAESPAVDSIDSADELRLGMLAAEQTFTWALERRTRR